MFSDYALIPLDLTHPPVDIDRLKSFVQQNCDQCAFANNAIRYVMFYSRKPVYNGQLILRACDPRFRSGLPDRYEWDPVFEFEFPDLVDWFESLPFIRLNGVELVTQTRDIKEHLDIFGNNNAETYYRKYRSIEPIYYRIVMTYPDDILARSRSFYVTREFGGEKQYAQLPAGTSTFALNSSICYHGATYIPGHYKTTMVVYGDLDRRRHLDLLNRSLERYRKNAVRFEGAGPVQGPGSEFPYRGTDNDAGH